MNKKNITIDTQFFNDQFDHSLNKYITEQIDPNYLKDSLKQVTSFRTKEKDSSHKDSFQNISHTDYQQYQYIPENQYSRSSNFNEEASYKPVSKAARQMQGANQIQKLLSQAMANAFISCWNTLNDLIKHDYQAHNQTHSHFIEGQKYFVQESRNSGKVNIAQDSINHSKRLNSTQLNMYQAQNQFGSKSQKSSLINNDKKKFQIIERQKRGITLDSLQKKRNSRSKSAKKQLTISEQRKIITQNSNDPRSVNFNEPAQHDLQKSNVSKSSKKSYREKFQEYKHEDKVNEDQIILNSYKKSATYSKFQTYNPKGQNQSHIHYNRIIKNNNNSQGQFDTNTYNQNRVGYDNSSTLRHNSYYGQKNQLLNNINQILQSKETINNRAYQHSNNKNFKITNETYKNRVYNVDRADYIDNVNNIHQQNINTLKNLSFSFHPNSQIMSHQQNIRYYHPASKNQLNIEYDQYQFARARLLQQIVDKLHYSKLKLMKEGQNDDKNQDFQMIRKLGKLQKLVLQLKVQNEKASRVKSEYEQKQSRGKRQYNSQYISRQEDQLYRKFTDELYTIRNQLSLLKNSKPTPQYNGDQTIIMEQKKLMTSFQESLTRLQQIQESHRQSQRPSFTQQPKSSNPQGQGSFLTQLIEQNKNKSSKQGWNQGWQQTEKVTELNKLSRRQIQLRGRDNLTNYRYTRNQILVDIGKKQQIEEQQRRMRDQQERILYEKEGKSTRIIRRVENQQEEEMMKKRPIRQKYEQQWFQYEKNKVDVDYAKNGCCSLFPCQ